MAPYCGGSHRAWAEGYVAHSCHDVTLLGLAARFWKWRMQGGVVTLAELARTVDEVPDVILASDMVNLPAFLGLTRDVLADVPTALYCHENQLTYPVPPGEKRDLTYGMINWLSMLAADRVFFNSQYHLDDWFGALPNMLRHFPDYSHLRHVDEVRARASVLPVGCDLSRLDAVPGPDGPSEPPLILWNQRWEYDKAPEVFFRALYALAEKGMGFRVAIAGRSYRQSAPEFEAAKERLGDRVVHFGYAQRESYERLLREADIVVSTAIHEFFGVAIVEAIYAGCLPVLPHRLAYPELIPEAHHQTCLYRNFERLLARLRWALNNAEAAHRIAEALRMVVARFDWQAVAPRYDRQLAVLARGGSVTGVESPG
ncbi:MAG: tRNA-queuosine alpha-mannosyltransferase domain-containing protein [Chloroflexota bacterium]